MNNSVKHFVKVVAAGIGIGILLLIIRSIFKIDEDVFMKGFWIAGTIVIAVAVLFNLLYVSGYRKKMKAAVLLMEEGRIDEYMAEVQKMLQTAKGRALKNLFRLNLSAGYCELKQFDKAIDILEELSGEKLRGEVEMVHAINLCLCYFYTEQNDRALELYGRSRRLFERSRNSPYYGGNIAVLDMLAAVAEGRTDEVEKMLAEAVETWDNPRLQEDFKNIEALIKNKES